MASRTTIRTPGLTHVLSRAHGVYRRPSICAGRERSTRHLVKCAVDLRRRHRSRVVDPPLDHLDERARCAKGISDMRRVTDPTGHEVIASAASGGHNLLNVGAHSLALGGVALLLTGMLAVTARLNAARELAVSAYVACALGAFCIVIAGIASGFLATGVAADAAELEGAARVTMMAMFHYTGRVNQAFAKVSVTFSAAAIIRWSIAMARTGFSRALGIYGMSFTALVPAAMAAGQLTLDIHGDGAVMIGQSVWMIWTGVLMRRLE